jgi:glyoxylase-like metal-dependent hydrolase (beta-lactamase superfamily II)
MNYIIKPLILGKMKMNCSLMTYLMNFHKELWVPIVCWYISVNGKNVLIDTGAPPDIMRRFWYDEYEEGISFEEALNSVDMSPGRIDVIIQTHLHFDHCGNTRKCYNAQVFIQKEELRFAKDPHPLFFGSYPKSILEGIQFREIEGDFEVLPGIHVFYIPGHSPGTQAVSIQTEKGRFVLSGFCSIKENFSPPEKIRKAWPILTPGVHINSLEAFKSALRVKELGDIVIPLHDMEYASQLEIP